MPPATGESVTLHRRLTFRLTAGVILVLLVIGVPFLLAFHSHQRRQQIDALAETTADLSRVIVDGLRTTMLAGQPRLLHAAVRDLATQEDVERVLLLDHEGRVRVASDPAYEGRMLDRERDLPCRVCHEPSGPAAESRTALASEGGRRVLRAMSAIPNEPACHGCHDPSAPTNGILMMDLSLEAADRRFFAGIGGTVAMGAVMVLLTVAVLVLLLRRMVHRPLGGIMAASRRIVAGDLDARAGTDGSGEFALLASQVNRMTDHLARSLRTVQTQRGELQAILDSVDDEIVVLDRQQRIVASNRAFQQRLGRDEPEISGRFCREVSASKWPCAVEQPGGCPVQRVFHTGRLHKGIMSRTDADGSERTIEIHASPLRGPGGGIALAVEVRRDISERRQMEATLANSERLASLGLLASGLSHEINNPLGAIATSVDGLRRRLPSEPGLPPPTARTLEEVLERIGREVQRGREITHRLLKVARPAGGVRSLIELNRVVEDIVAVLSHQIEQSGVEASLELGEGIPPLPGDESRLGQVVMNLALNALQSMEGRGGRMRIATRAAEGAIELVVEDAGCGIPAALLRRIYEPFFTTKPPGKGTGLGLFITHQIVAEMGGEIRVRSEPDRGTTVTVRIPAGAAGQGVGTGEVS